MKCFSQKNVREILANGESRFRKTVPTKAEAQRLEREIQTKIETVTQTGTDRVMSLKGEISFKDFYETLWLPLYEAGGSGRIRTIPTKATVDQTKNIFRLHLLPLFGKYSLTYLNEHNQIVMEELAILGEQYANIRTIKSYVGQLFDVAEAADFIEVNRIAKILRFVNSPKKKRLHDKRVAEGEALTADELIAWIDAARTDLESGKLSEEEYLLFVLTLNLGDRKSESYGLRWRYVDLENGYIYVMNALNKHKELGPTKGHKQTKIQVPDFIIALLKKWKEHQADQLASVGITNLDGEQFVFTYTDNRGT
ncbi:site-specific integrase [Lacticaseibacillus manihotivorans]|uniref:site-specific integrase n=1 Tax=Lacticaseibacillus manihotivorans TaxID=88233 RepID=UPI001FB55902|nr:tyrosine-type recombinase/integrase [Lacticaseibacillus manihotivorans]